MMNLGLLDPAFLGSLTSYDPDAAVYIAAVEAADGQALETGVKDAINAFVLGCKADGIWNAIKASCILAGARTLAGALVPLVGTAPTNPFVNPANESLGRLFVSGDYNRKTGLVGNGSTKYLDSNRNNNVDPQNSKHGAVYISTNHTSGAAGPNTFPVYLGTGASATGAFTFGRLDSNSTSFFSRLNNATVDTIAGANTATGMAGMSRSTATAYVFRANSASTTIARDSQAPFNGSIGVFREGAGAATTNTYSNARLAFYSIGESLDLALLDARVTALVNALAVAIP